jgi:hypothetical protein
LIILMYHLVPKSARPATKSLNIRNFVKPFDELEARRFLEKFGELDYFWLEGSQCFVTVRNLINNSLEVAGDYLRGRNPCTLIKVVNSFINTIYSTLQSKKRQKREKERIT